MTVTASGLSGTALEQDFLNLQQTNKQAIDAEQDPVKKQKLAADFASKCGEVVQEAIKRLSSASQKELNEKIEEVANENFSFDPKT